MSLAFSWRNVTRHKLRTFLIITAITVSVALETGIAITIDSIYQDFIENHRGNNFTDITVHPKSNSTVEDMKNLAEDLGSVKRVEKVSPVVIFPVLKNSSGLENITNNIILYGLETDSHPDYPSLAAADDGNYPLEPPEVIISMNIASELNTYESGKLYIPEIEQLGFKGLNATVHGLMSDVSYFGNYFGYLFILIDLDYMVNLFTSDDYLNFHLTVKVKDFINLNRIAKDIQDFVGLDYHVYREKTVSETDVLAIQSYQAAMNLIIIASIVLEFLFIVNILSMNVRDRTREFGVLRSIGSSNLQILTFLALELLIYSGIASFIGSFLGIGFSIFSVFILNLYFSKVRIESVILNPVTLFTSYTTGILITLIAGLYPTFKAISLPVVQNIHYTIRRKISKSRIWLYFIIVGAFLTFMGLITTNFIGASRFLVFEIISWHFFAVLAIFIGIFLLETGLLHFLPKIGMKLMIWYKTVPRTIATRNIEREAQKSTITIMVTALALSFILVIGIISAALLESVPDYYEKRYGRIDIIAETRDNVEVPLSFGDEIVQNNSDIERAEFMQQQRTVIGNTEGYVFGINPDSYKYFFEEMMLSPPEPDIPVLLNTTEKGAIISDILLSRIGARINEDLSIQVSSNSSINVKLTGITSGNPFLQDGHYLYISSALFREYWSNNSATWFIMKTFPDSDPDSIVASQLSGLYQKEFKEVIPVDHYANIIRGSLTVSSMFFQILIVYTFLLSALAQFLSIFISILKMEREIGIMRAMGLSHNAVLSIYSAESTLLGTTGVIIGIINGLIGSELMSWYIGFSIPIHTNISINFIAFWVIVSIGITIISSEITTRRSMQRVVADIIHSEGAFRSRKRISWRDWEQFMDSYRDEKGDIVSPFLRFYTDQEDEEE